MTEILLAYEQPDGPSRPYHPFGRNNERHTVNAAGVLQSMGFEVFGAVGTTPDAAVPSIEDVIIIPAPVRSMRGVVEGVLSGVLGTGIGFVRSDNFLTGGRTNGERWQVTPGNNVSADYVQEQFTF
jgi:hypothetical protein